MIECGTALVQTEKRNCVELVCISVFEKRREGTTDQRIKLVVETFLWWPGRLWVKFHFRRINLEFHLMAPGKNRKQRSDCFFLLYTITTNISETFTNL